MFYGTRFIAFCAWMRLRNWPQRMTITCERRLQIRHGSRSASDRSRFASSSLMNSFF